jgi:DNA-binding helix-hairpin-helix protein with protein kinase domain
VPVLRVALAEPQFFSDLNHPARKLIDRMGSCVMGFDASSINGNALETEIRRVVQVIEQYPETGQKVFALVLREFEAFLTKHFAQNRSTAKITSVAQQVEQKETLAIQYTIELRNMLTDMPVREEVRDFLFKSWADVLAMATVRYGAKDARAMRSSRRPASWSGRPAPSRSRQERARHPGLDHAADLARRAGAGERDGEAQSTAIKVLTDTLAQAFMSKTAAIPTERIEAMAKRLSELENTSARTASSTICRCPESIELMLGVDAAI